MPAKIFQKLVTLGLVVSGVQVMPGTARALSCATNVIQAPAHRAVDVPTNTLLWAYGRLGGASRARLIGPAGEVPTAERFFTVAIALGQGTNFPVLVPQAELEANTRYQIAYDYTDIDDVITTETVSFTTGSGPATSAPLTPELTSSEPGAYNGEIGGINRYLRLAVAHEGILIADSAGALGTIDTAEDLWLPEDAGFDSVALRPETPAVRWTTLDKELRVGLGDCLVWPETAADRESARFGVFDLAGNFSGWSESVELTLPSLTEAEALIAASPSVEAPGGQTAPARPVAFQERSSGCSLSALTSSPQRSGWCLAALGAALAAVRRCSRGRSGCGHETRPRLRTGAMTAARARRFVR